MRNIIKSKMKDNRREGDRSLAKGKGTKRWRREERARKGPEKQLICVMCMFQLLTMNVILILKHIPVKIKTNKQLTKDQAATGITKEIMK